MMRTVLAVLVASTSLASADPAASPPMKQIRNARLSEGTPSWIEGTASDAFVALDTFRDRHRERTYLVVPLKNELGSKLLFEAVEKAFGTRSPIGVAWIETP